MTAITHVEGEGQKGADLRARWLSDMAVTAGAQACGELRNTLCRCLTQLKQNKLNRSFVFVAKSAGPCLK